MDGGRKNGETRSSLGRVKRRTSHEPNRMLMKLNEGEQRVFLICIRFGSCEVQRLTRALAQLSPFLTSFKLPFH